MLCMAVLSSAASLPISFSFTPSMNFFLPLTSGAFLLLPPCQGGVGGVGFQADRGAPPWPSTFSAGAAAAEEKRSPAAVAPVAAGSRLAHHPGRYSSFHASSYFARCSSGSGEAKYDIPMKSAVFTSRPKKPGAGALPTLMGGGPEAKKV